MAKQQRKPSKPRQSQGPPSPGPDTNYSGLTDQDARLSRLRLEAQTQRALARMPSIPFPLRTGVYPAPEPACVYGQEHAYDLAYCRTCELNASCTLSAYQGWNISAGKSYDSSARGLKLVQLLDRESYALDPHTGERLYHPIRKRPLRVVNPARWGWWNPSYDEGRRNEQAQGELHARAGEVENPGEPQERE